MSEIREVFCLRGNEIETWKVTGATAKTLTIESTSRYLPGWTKRIRIAEMGLEFHSTKLAAVQRAIENANDKERQLKDQLQRVRSVRGVYESMLKHVAEVERVP